MSLYVAEIGINHNGDMDNVLKLIDLAKKHHFDYIKFQKRDIELCYTKEFLDSPRESPWGTTQRDQKLGLELSYDQFKIIDNYCKEIGIDWFYSPWDLKSASDMFSKFRTDFVKISHASNNNKLLADFYKNTSAHLIVSCNPFVEDLNDIPFFKLESQIKYILGCVSLYPSPNNYSGLGIIGYLNSKIHNGPPFSIKYNLYHSRIGFSNHSSEWIFPVMAEYLGAEMVEVHITLDKNMYGSDQKASLDDNDLTNMMKFRNSFTIDNSFVFDSFVEKEKAILMKLRQTW